MTTCALLSTATHIAADGHDTDVRPFDCVTIAAGVVHVVPVNCVANDPDVNAAQKLDVGQSTSAAPAFAPMNTGAVQVGPVYFMKLPRVSIAMHNVVDAHDRANTPFDVPLTFVSTWVRPDHVVPFHFVAYPWKSNAWQNATVGHDTRVKFPFGSSPGVADQVVPLNVRASPPAVTAPQNVAVGQEMATRPHSDGTACGAVQDVPLNFIHWSAPSTATQNVGDAHETV